MHVGRMIVVLTAKSCPSFYFEGKKVLHIFFFGYGTETYDASVS